MPRGKKGPVPDALEDLNKDPTAEEIVGKENVVDVGSPYAIDTDIKQPAGYKCADCTFTSSHLSDIEEHCNGTGHGGFKQEDSEPVQPELFRPPGVIRRSLEIPLPEDVILQQRERLANLYQSSLDVKEEKREADSDFNARLKNLDEQMQACARVLKTPHTYENVDCEWRILEGENARGLFRLDSGEMVDKQPLTAEDRAEELRQAENANAQPVEA